MTPDDVTAVQRSWAELRTRRLHLRGALTRQFKLCATSPIPASTRAQWLLDATAELVDLLPTPSRLADRARALGPSWPDPLVAPSFATEGRAWLAAAAECKRTWTRSEADAWRQAWLLLSDVLAAESLSPFEKSPRGT